MSPRRFTVPALLLALALLAAIAYGVHRATGTLWGPALAGAAAAWYLSDMFGRRQPSGQEHLTENPDRRR